MPILAKACKVALDRVPLSINRALQFTDRSVETFNLQRMESYRLNRKAWPTHRGALSASWGSFADCPPPAWPDLQTHRTVGLQSSPKSPSAEPFDPELLREVLIRGFGR
jgi:hypothetical protein